MSGQHSHDDDTFQQHVTDAVGDIIERRALTEQTKGMLMFVYGISAEKAFEILRKQSQDHNVKLSLIAEQIQRDLMELSRSKPFDRRIASDSLLLTAHQRVTHVASRLLDGQFEID